MARITRRDCIQKSLSTVAAGAALATASAKPVNSNGRGIKFAEMLSTGQTSRMRTLRQMGVTHGIAGVAGILEKTPRSGYYDALLKIKDEFATEGITIAGVESHPVPAEKIKLGLPGRDEEIENYKAAIEALSRAGIPMICYNWMAGIGWYRTKTNATERGGALISEFDIDAARALGLTQWVDISEEKVWANMEYFQKAVMPVAERFNVQMALHPDDPPVSPLRGIARILTSAKNYRRVMSIVPSPINGVTFCQANFKLMGEDIYSLAKEWCGQKKIFFVHFRDVAGTAQHFHETFHDDGPTDMARMLRVYSENGFEGPMRPDHAPTMEGESNDHPGYAMVGKVYAFGYMKGIMDALQLPYA